MNTVRRVLLAGLVLAAVACDDRPPDQTAPAAAQDTASADASIDGPSADAGIPADSTAAPDTTAPSQPHAALALEGEGLRVFLVHSGSARPIPFGMPESDAMDMLTRVLGAPRERGHSEDCGVDYATWADGLTARFSRGSFVGWSVGSGSTHTTASGVGVGSTRAELEGAYAVDVVRSTLGLEFSAGTLAGVLEPGPGDARVLHLWAGRACLAR